jgi:hypothetical protein
MTKNENDLNSNGRRFVPSYAARGTEREDVST